MAASLASVSRATLRYELQLKNSEKLDRLDIHSLQGQRASQRKEPFTYDSVHQTYIQIPLNSHKYPKTLRLYRLWQTPNQQVNSSINLELQVSNAHLAWPIADQALTQNILDLVQQASHFRQLKKGANEGALDMLYRLHET